MSQPSSALPPHFGMSDDDEPTEDDHELAKTSGSAPLDPKLLLLSAVGGALVALLLGAGIVLLVVLV